MQELSTDLAIRKAVAVLTRLGIAFLGQLVDVGVGTDDASDVTGIARCWLPDSAQTRTSSHSMSATRSRRESENC